MRDSFDSIITQFGNLTDKEKQQVALSLSNHFGKSIQISLTALPAYSKEEIEIITNTLNGLMLTKQNVPNMRAAYERLKDTDIPRKV